MGGASDLLMAPPAARILRLRQSVMAGTTFWRAVSLFVLLPAAGTLTVPSALAAPPPEAGKALSPVESARRDSMEHYLRAKLMVTDGEVTEALKEFRKAVEIDPNDGHLRREYAEALRDVQILPEAEEQARKAVALIPENAAAHRTLGQILLATSKDKKGVEEAAAELKRSTEALPGDPAGAMAYAQALLRLDRAQEAVPVLERVLEKGRGPAMTLLYGEALERSGRYGEAEDVLRFLLRQDPDSPAAYFSLLRLYEKSRQVDKATDLVQSFLRKHPGNVGLRTEYGQLLVRSRRFPDAEKVLGEVLKADPENREALRSYATVLIETKRPEKADEILAKLQQLDPDDPDVPFRRALFLLEARKIAEAEKVLGDLKASLIARKMSREGLAQVDGQLAYAAYLRKDFRAARALLLPQLKNGVGAGGDGVQAFNLLLQIARDEKDDAEGLRVAREAASKGTPPPAVKASLAEFLLRSPKPADKEEGGKLLDALAAVDRPGALMAADTWQRLEKFGRAAEVAKEALSRFPDDPDLLFRLGASLERDQKGPAAVDAFERLLKVRPDHAPAMNYLGYYWADRSENLERAHDLIRKAVELDPANGAYLDSLGWVLYQLNRPDEAEKFLAEAAQMTPDDPTVLEHLGDVAAKQGHVARARDLWKKALGMNPEDGGKKLEEKLRKTASAAP